MLPYAIRFAMLTDLALNAIAAVIGSEHGLLVQSQIAQFGVLVAAGIVLHEVSNMLGKVVRSILRWSRRPQRARRSVPVTPRQETNPPGPPPRNN
jgi:hypothetical protein